MAQLDEPWFHAVSTYITLARRDGQPQVEEQLTAVLRAAAAAKDATLRPEIRLLNALMRVTTAAERELLYQRHAAALVRCADPRLAARCLTRVRGQLTSAVTSALGRAAHCRAHEPHGVLRAHVFARVRSDNEYFFTLLARMTADVEQQPGGALNPGQRDTLTMLRTIAKEARRRKTERAP